MKTAEPNWQIIEHLSNAPESQLDNAMCDKLKEILTLRDKPESNKEIADGLLYVLDMCVHASLASGMVIKILDAEWRAMGGTIEENNANCPWRNK